MNYNKNNNDNNPWGSGGGNNPWGSGGGSNNMDFEDSIKKAREALKNKADYIAIGAFNSSKTKKVKYRATIKDLKKIR